jgi:hypothetical protein
MRGDCPRYPCSVRWSAPGRIASRTRYLGLVATVIEKHPNGTVAVVMPAVDSAGLEIGAFVDVRLAGAAAEVLPWPFGALADKYSPLEIEEIKASRREAPLHGAG